MKKEPPIVVGIVVPADQIGSQAVAGFDGPITDATSLSDRSDSELRTRGRRSSRSKRPDPRTHEGLEQRLSQAIHVPLATRLHPGTASSLRRAHLERKLRGELPFSQQEIVEQALCNWLRKEGYLRTE